MDDEVMTLSEIESRFPEEWVLVEDPHTDEALRVVRGKVRFHHRDRDEVYRKAREFRPKHFAMLYTGAIAGISETVLEAMEEPVVVTKHDDAADDLIARHPDFRASVERARRQKAVGQVRSLAELRRKLQSGSGTTGRSRRGPAL